MKVFSKQTDVYYLTIELVNRCIMELLRAFTPPCSSLSYSPVIIGCIGNRYNRAINEHHFMNNLFYFMGAFEDVFLIGSQRVHNYLVIRRSEMMEYEG